MSKSGRIRQIVMHISLCLLFLSVPFFMGPGVADWRSLPRSPFLQRHLLSFILLIILFYMNYYLLIPRLYFRRRFISYILVLLLALCIVSFVPHLLLPEHMPPPGDPGRPAHKAPLISMDMSQNFFSFLVVVFASLMLRINARWKKTEDEKLQAEVSLLKAQINPHFLFNTLNGIYALAIEKSDLTADAIVKLSGMMRYVLTEGNRDFVTLPKEIGYISDYIELQKIRLGNTAILHFTTEGDFNGIRIAPMLLVTFIENAFKHGVNPDEISDIHIHISCRNHILEMQVRNRIVRRHADKRADSGIGLENTLERLQHLYPGKYRLQTEEKDAYFNVWLQIEL